MQFQQRQRRRDVSINMSPLVDVVFLLVIFFAVSTTFLETAGLELELPESTSTSKREARDLTVLLGEDGTLSFDGETMSNEQLGRQLKQALEEQDKKQVILRADTAAKHGDVVHVMDIIRDAGADSMTVAAKSVASGD